MRKVVKTIFCLILVACFGAIFAQNKPPAKPPGPPPKPGKAAPPAKPPVVNQKPAAPPAKPAAVNQPAAAGKEERELANVPKPSAAKLPEAKYENEDMSKNALRGTITVAFSAGLYNFTNKTENPNTNTSRTYSLPFDGLYTTMLGFDAAFRLGRDKDKDHDSGTGFHYYRSNKGIFTDFEFGAKAQRTENKPSRFDFSESSAAGTTNAAVDLGADTTTLPASSTAVQNLSKAGISSQLKQAVGTKAAEVTMFYANTYYHLTPLNFILNWGSAFRWFDSSIGPSLRVWYYRDYSDPVRTANRNDDWTYATFMVVYRQYIQFHSLVRLRTHFYFPALSYFTQLAKSPRFNENEFILNTALEFYAIRLGSVGAIVSVGYEGHWWTANPYSTDRYVRTGFTGDTVTDSVYAGFEHKTRTSWEAFATVAFEFHLGEASEKAAAEMMANPATATNPAKPAAPAGKKPR